MLIDDLLHNLAEKGGDCNYTAFFTLVVFLFIWELDGFEEENGDCRRCQVQKLQKV